MLTTAMLTKIADLRGRRKAATHPSPPTLALTRTTLHTPHFTFPLATHTHHTPPRLPFSLRRTASPHSMPP
mgnify:CR=1 FL=1